MQESSDSAPLLTEHDYIGLSEVSSSISPLLPSPGCDHHNGVPSSDLAIGLDLGLGLGLGLGPASSSSSSSSLSAAAAAAAAASKEESAAKRCDAGEGALKSHCCVHHDSSPKYAAFPEFLPLPSSLLHKNGAKRGFAEANICGALKKNDARFHHHSPHPLHLDSSPASFLPAVEASASASSSSPPEQQHAKPLMSPSFLPTWPLPPSTSSSSMKMNGTLNSNSASAVPVNPWHADKPASTNAFSASEKASDMASADDAPPCKDRVVGWPPVRSYRRQSLSKPAESFVKVNMDGITVGRKVDLNAYASYESLLRALEEMFQPSSNAQGASQALPGREKHFLLSGGSDFVLTYEDKEGDWMLVGDVPWSMFISTVKRLRIARGSEANTPASRGPEKSRL